MDVSHVNSTKGRALSAFAKTFMKAAESAIMRDPTLVAKVINETKTRPEELFGGVKNNTALKDAVNYEVQVRTNGRTNDRRVKDMRAIRERETIKVAEELCATLRGVFQDHQIAAWMRGQNNVERYKGAALQEFAYDTTNENLKAICFKLNQ